MTYRFCWALLALLLAFRAPAQSVSGVWQGVESDTGEGDRRWPSVLRLQQAKSGGLFGVLYQEVGDDPSVSVTFQVKATWAGASLRLEHLRKLNETRQTAFSYWCEGFITFTYDPAQEKLTGRATYRPVGDCDVGTFTFYRVKLKSAATVPAGVETTIRVSGRNVVWYADAELKKPVTTGNTYRTRLSKPTTFYLTQGYYPTKQSPVASITIQTTAAAAAPKPEPAPPVAVLPPADTARPAVSPPPVLSATPVVLPTVLFKLGTAELLPTSRPALDQLVATLQARPTLKLRVAGHTDRIGEPQKNQALSEQRAEAVKSYLVRGGIAAGRISTIGYGDARPLYASPDARNRRVEVAEEID